MHKAKIGFIGGGNMTRAIVTGLIKDGYPADCIWVADRNAQKRDFFQMQCRTQVLEDLELVVAAVDILILAVKPQHLSGVLGQLRSEVLLHKPVVVSIALGWSIADLQRLLSTEVPLIRAMPNTPSMVQTGVTALLADKAISQHQKSVVEALFRSVGLIFWLETEEQIENVTVLAGSGPAYFFLFMEVLQQLAQSLGIDEQTAHLLVLQTGLGATKMALESSDCLSTLRAQVCSKGGATEAAVAHMQQHGLADLLRGAIDAAQARRESLSQLWSKNAPLADMRE